MGLQNNFGFSYMQEKIETDPNYFFKETASLHEFLLFLKPKEDTITEMNNWKKLNSVMEYCLYPFVVFASQSSTSFWRWRACWLKESPAERMEER